MKTVKQLSPILQKMYDDYKKLDIQSKETKDAMARKKSHIIAWLKKEQTDGFIVNGINVIRIIEKKGSVSVDKNLLKLKHPNDYNQFFKIGNSSTTLLIK